ncbi:hypothetical protein [Fimbriiglobus ruber]|uniref:hypothetical protein n=1 Tax=Fimbriiglobus ruber TaxID=1908690 RepID=UPI001179C337|nr:hypothetical protein [Fimbriiglobus ruber]
MTPEVQNAIVRVILAGMPRSVAAAYVNVQPRTLQIWLSRGKEENSEPCYRELREAVLQAEASAVVRNVAHIQQAAAGDWRAAAWWLERRSAHFFRERIPLAEFERRIHKIEEHDRLKELSNKVETGEQRSLPDTTRM